MVNGQIAPVRCNKMLIVIGPLICTFAHSKNKVIRIADMHFPYAPRHVGGQPGNFDFLFSKISMNSIEVINSGQNPDCLFNGVICIRTEGWAISVSLATAIHWSDGLGVI